jgi:transposase-like protein
MNDIQCKRCGCSNLTKRGFQMYANEPHKRQKYQCKSCGHTFVFVQDTDKLEEAEGNNEQK